MVRDSVVVRLATAAALTGLIALGATTGGAAAAPQSDSTARLPNCNPATNIENIVDDSGSMSANDPSSFRRDLVDILASAPINTGKRMGAVEFGTQANALFGPTGPVTLPSSAIVENGLNLIQSDNGGTDYNEGFALAKSHNPTANARVFLSDGEHNVGAYNPNSHRVPNVKTFVVGFGQVDPTLLNQIAAETRAGTPFIVNSTVELLTVAGRILARLNCQTDPKQFVDRFNRRGQREGHKFKPQGKTSDLLLTWPIEGDVLKLATFRQEGDKVKAKRVREENFFSVRLKGLDKGEKVKFQVKAGTLPIPTVATTQVIP